MAILLVAPRYKKRLRKQRSAMLPQSGRARFVASSGKDALDMQDPRSTETEGVVRVGYSISRTNADQIDSILCQIRQATGKACSASEIIRIAITDVAQRPLPEVISLLEKIERKKPGRRPRG